MADFSASAEWRGLLTEIEEEIRRVGYWSGEARRLRDAAGVQRLTPRSGARIVAALSDSGYECDPPDVRYESASLLIGRIGASELAATLESLLPAIRAADRAVTSIATFRDANVARLALRAWPGRTRPPGQI